VLDTVILVVATAFAVAGVGGLILDQYARREPRGDASPTISDGRYCGRSA